MAVVQVAPHGGGTQLLGEQQKKSQRSFGKKKPRVQVPGTLRALMLLPTAKWLQVGIGTDQARLLSIWK